MHDDAGVWDGGWSPGAFRTLSHEATATLPKAPGSSPTRSMGKLDSLEREWKHVRRPDSIFSIRSRLSC